ncbi:MAG: HIT family protein [Actinobacteria bacterium]|nr:HIT family protein [Actinomycetota bacterium]
MADVPVPAGCYSCSISARLGALPVRDATWVEGGWYLAHNFEGGLPGWFVLVPQRHVLALDELTEAEGEAMGRLLVRVTAALRAVVGCTKTYTLLLAEKPGFAHLHVHVVPRMPDLPPDRVGPRIFGYADDEPVAERERDRISGLVRDHLASH